jgi:hypothetical protein
VVTAVGEQLSSCRIDLVRSGGVHLWLRLPEPTSLSWAPRKRDMSQGSVRAALRLSAGCLAAAQIGTISCT